MTIYLKHLAKASHSVQWMLAIIIFIIIGAKQMNEGGNWCVGDESDIYVLFQI